MKRWPVLLLIVCIVGLGTAYVFRGSFRDAWQSWTAPALPKAAAYHPVATTTETVVWMQPSPEPTSTPARLPTAKPAKTTAATSTDPLAWKGAFPQEMNLAVPFLSQAPKQNWDMPYQEACEEAAAIMVDAYYRGRTDAFAPEEGDEAILAAVAYETDHNLPPDFTAEQDAAFIRDYLGDKRVIVRPVTGPSDIKAALAHGYPVMVPAYGKALGNPNYRNGGPLYHMLVIKGYLADGQWITNDSGTRKGADYLYDMDILLNALHDWNAGDVPNGKPVMIVILPNS